MKCDRILVCMSSLLRYFDVSAKSFVDNIVDTLPTRPDFVGHFPSTSDTRCNASVLCYMENYFDEFHVKFEEDRKMTTKETALSKNMTPHQRNGVVGNLLQWSSMKKCKQLKIKFEQTFGNYDLVIWARPDLFYYNQLENIGDLTDGFYLVGHDNHLGGLNDRFCMGSSTDMNMRMNILDYFTDEWYPKFHDDKNVLFSAKHGLHKGCGFQWNPEMVLGTYIKNKLKLNIGKLGLCFGKMRSSTYASEPYWFNIHGDDFTGKYCRDDVFNETVYTSVKSSRVNSNDASSHWGLVDTTRFALK